jgi:two-component system, OmpR family, sensor histidine kinase BaeS
MNLRIKLLLSYVLVVAVTLVSIVWIARQGVAREVNQFMTAQGMVGETDLARKLESYYNQMGTWMGVEAVLPQVGGRGMGMMGSQRIRVADAGGVVAADTRDLTGEILSPAELSAAVILRDDTGAAIGYLLAEAGTGNGMMGNSNQAGANLLLRLTSASLTAALIGGGLALLVAMFVGYQLLKPVSALTRAARALAGGDLSQRVEAKGADELGELGRGFNRMAETLQRSEQNRRSMTADIAHELRTPIAVQRAHLEALQDGVYPLTPENLQPVLDQTELLARLVDDLRTLALADAGELRLERSAVQPAELVRRVLERFRAEADNRLVELSGEIDPEGVPVIFADVRRVEQILNNLVGNALRYTPSKGRIRIRVSRLNDQLELLVSDTGPGIPTDALDHLFERFYRADRSRSREDGGTGLGLAIARQLAVAHGGDLSAQNRAQGGAEFRLQLPIHEPA